MKKKFFLNVFVTIGLLLIIAVNVLFVKEVGRYGSIASTISSIEREGNRTVYTKNGAKTGWELNPELISKYNSQQKKKSELIESSDIASWLATSAETVTGQVIRIVAILVSAILLVLAAYTLFRVLLQDMGYLIKILRID